MTSDRYFFRGPGALTVVDEAFATILPYGASILSFFREYPESLENPYRLKKLYHHEYFDYVIDVSAAENQIVTSFYNNGIEIDSVKADSPSSVWHRVMFPKPPSDLINPYAWIALNIRAHAVIDLSIYYTYLANMYVPNAGLIRNLYATNVETDALGRLNENHAAEAITRSLRKYGSSDGDRQQHVRHIIMMMKHDAIVPARSPLSRGLSFEQECLGALVSENFDVRTTPVSGDYGADLIAIKDGLGFAIQCKDTSKPVGVKAIQEAVAARSHYKVDFAAVCATARFTDAAIELATSNNVILSNLANLARRLDAA